MIILSPHIDDATFSLGLTLVRAKKLMLKFRIINFFSFSAYRLGGQNEDPVYITEIRKEEENAMLQLLNGNVHSDYLDLPDAPLRKEFSVHQYQRLTGLLSEDRDTYQILKKAFPDFATTDILFIPLGIGYHVDHILLREAALEKASQCTIVFYEDLPYAGRSNASQTQHFISAIEEKYAMSLTPAFIPGENNWDQKLNLISAYQTQLDPETITEIHNAFSICGGERFWLTEKSIQDKRIQLLIGE